MKDIRQEKASKAPSTIDLDALRLQRQTMLPGDPALEPSGTGDWRPLAHAEVLAEEPRAFEFVPRSKASKRMAMLFQKLHGPILSEALCMALNEMDEESELLVGRMAMLRTHAAERFPVGTIAPEAFEPSTMFAARQILPMFRWNGDLRPMRTFEVELCKAAESAYQDMLKARLKARALACG